MQALCVMMARLFNSGVTSMNRLLLAFSAIILITGCASEKPAESALNPIDAFEMQCKINSPQKLCFCVSSRLRLKVEQGEDVLDVMSDKDNTLHDITTGCMISTGMVRAMMNDFSLACYVNDPEDLVKLDAENRNIAYLQQQYPEKTKSCACLQAEVDKLDEAYFLKESIAAHEAYEALMRCKMETPNADCPKTRISFAEPIGKKCGLSKK